MVRGLVVTSIYLVSLVAILFASAGQIDWPMGWASLGVVLVISLRLYAVVVWKVRRSDR